MNIVDIAIELDKLSYTDKVKMQNLFSYRAETGKSVKGEIFTPEQCNQFRQIIKWLEFNIAFGSDWYPPSEIEML